MLVLTRKPQERIRIGDDIVVTVLRTKGQAVRIGIEAPGNVRVLRGEIAFETDAEQQAPEGEQDSPQTFHARVPRRQVHSLAPHVAGSGGPLAAMMYAGESI